MPKPLNSPDRLFDRTWRPGHPFGRRLSGTRRWTMAALFIVLCALIGGYLFVTDSHRVRAMAESYLSSLLGGPVTVGNATLSIFEGLRLDNVRLYAGEEPKKDDELFTAVSFIISYDPQALLSGRIEATRIVAVEPNLYLTEELDTGLWSHGRLGSRNFGSGGGAGGVSVNVLPEIILRNATVKYRQTENGRVTAQGSMGIEGQLTPASDGRTYSFLLQSRGQRQAMGPVATGFLNPATRQVSISLKGVVFGDDVRGMMPRLVRQWWEQHELAGNLDIEVDFHPPRQGGSEPSFRAETKLQGVTLTVQPEEWMSQEESARMRVAHDALNLLRTCGLNGGGLADRLSELIEPNPLRLQGVVATFVFDEQGIAIRNLTGKLEDIEFFIGGRIDGYSPSASWDLNVRSLETRNVRIPETPRYVTSMPPAVREVYDHFRPSGECKFWVRVNRPRPGGRLRVTGEIDVIDGQFTFDKFPYPLRDTTGKIVLVYDDVTGYDGLRIERIRGRGIEGGPNAHSYVEINGTMGPFRSDVGVDITVTGQNISNEAALMAAFPQQTRTALSAFDAPGTGEFPKFRGDFGCRIVRLPQLVSKWIIETDIELDEGAGMLEMFPYPLSGVRGKLKVYDDRVEIVHARMEKGDASIDVGGRISWRSSEDTDPRARRATTRPPSLRPDLRINAKNVPIDRDLLSALPDDRRAWIEKIGLGGKVDIEGTIKAGHRAATAPAIANAMDAAAERPAAASASDLDFDLRLKLKEGTIWPADGGTFAVSDMSGEMALTPERLTISRLVGRRGNADLAASGSVSWTSVPAQFVLLADAKNLELDSALYRMIPDAAKRGWEQVRPEGSVDASLSYSGEIGGATAPTTAPGIADALPAPAPTTRPSSFELKLTPRQLAATPAAVPYRLEQLAGSLVVLPDRVILKDITGTHGDAKVSLSGTGTPVPDGAWQFQIHASNVTVDDEFCAALPQALAELMQSMKLAGQIDLEFPKLHVLATAPAEPEPVESQAGPTTRGEPGRSADIDFDMILRLRPGSSMDVGVPLTDVRGSSNLTGSTRDGKLYELGGGIDIPSLKMANRDVTDFRGWIYKPRGRDALQIGKMEARLAGGTLAGEVNFAFPDEGTSRYALALVLREADVPTLTGETEQEIRGQVSASLALEGAYNDPDSRRGRGDVAVAGEQMYRIPIVLGLLQITNLALPITSPFREASARYSIEGQRITFEQIELRAKEMMMQGTGFIDFASRRVRMTFTTNSTGWPKLPFIGDLLQTARHELLQIHVRGTIQEPKISASSMNTFTTTIDEVFRGSGNGNERDVEDGKRR